MLNKANKEAMLIIASGIILAGSAVWKISDSHYQKQNEIILTTSANETTAASHHTTTEKLTTAAIQTETEYLMLDINSANESELLQLKGIGEHLAAEIAKYRTEHGRFLNIEELMNVSGIGKETFEDIRGHVYVVDPIYTTTAPPRKQTPATEEEVIETTEAAETAEDEPTEPELTLEDIAPININTADIDALILLPHVDEKSAEEIVSLREKLGKFSNTYELLYVESLTQSEVADILEYVVAE